VRQSWKPQQQLTAKSFTYKSFTSYIFGSPLSILGIDKGFSHIKRQPFRFSQTYYCRYSLSNQAKNQMNSKFIISIFLVFVSFSAFSQAGGQTCGAAEQIFCGSAYSSATAGTTPDGYSNCGTEGTAGQRWYYFVSPGNGTVTLSL
jgi:hypothetical protein